MLQRYYILAHLNVEDFFTQGAESEVRECIAVVQHPLVDSGHHVKLEFLKKSDVEWEYGRDCVVEPVGRLFRH